jgi:hypothetical protein
MQKWPLLAKKQPPLHADDLHKKEPDLTLGKCEGHANIGSLETGAKCRWLFGGE